MSKFEVGIEIRSLRSEGTLREHKVYEHRITIETR
jgi:hypothetical protein